MSGNHNKHQKQNYQYPSCGGFCKRSGCERENTPEPTSAEYAMGYAEGFNDACAPKKEWVGLTPADYESLEQLFGSKVSNDFVFSDILCTVEARLKEKNHG